MSELLENEVVRYWIEDGILFSEFLNPIELNLENSKVIVDLRHQISNNTKQYWCYDFRNVKAMDRESRDYADKHGQELLHASSAIVASKIQAFIVNIFIKLKNPKILFKAFSNRAEAINWLMEIKAKNALIE